MKWFKKKRNTIINNESEQRADFFNVLNIKANNNPDENYTTKKTTNTKDLFRSAFDKFVLKKDKEAIAILDELLEKDINNAEVYAMRASCLNNIGYHLDAIDDYKKSLDLKEDANNYGLCGCAYMLIGEYQLAYSFLEKAVTKGMKMYLAQLSIVEITLDDDLFYESLKKRAISENRFKRRRKSKLNFNIESSPADVIEALNSMLPNLKTTIELDPDNKELKETYDKAKQNLNLIELLRLYLTQKDVSTKENMIEDLVKINYKPKEAEEIAIMFFKSLNKEK